MGMTIAPALYRKLSFDPSKDFEETVPMIRERRIKVFDVTTLKRLGSLPNLAMLDPMAKQRLSDLSSDIVLQDKMTPAGLRTHLESEIAKWAPVIKKAGIYAD